MLLRSIGLPVTASKLFDLALMSLGLTSPSSSLNSIVGSRLNQETDSRGRQLMRRPGVGCDGDDPAIGVPLRLVRRPGVDRDGGDRAIGVPLRLVVELVPRVCIGLPFVAAPASVVL